MALTPAPQPAGEVGLLDVAVAAPALPVPEVGVAEGVPEKGDHPLLGEDLPLADGAHVPGSTTFQ